MRLDFDVVCNYDIPYLDHAVFEDKNGKEIILDRDETWYNSSSGTLTSMEWRSVYTWNYDNYEESYEFSKEFFNGLKFKEFFIECEAPEDYYCNCTACGYEEYFTDDTLTCGDIPIISQAKETEE